MKLDGATVHTQPSCYQKFKFTKIPHPQKKQIAMAQAQEPPLKNSEVS